MVIKLNKIKVKVMNLDMFDFEYIPIFDENEKVYYSNGQIYVTHNNRQCILSEKNVFNVQRDKNFYERVATNSGLSIEELLEGLEKNLNGENIEEKYALLMVNEDMEKSTFNKMIEVFFELNYKTSAFSYIAYGDYSEIELEEYKDSLNES